MSLRTDEVEKREVMRSEDPFGIPACFYWTVDDVANWVESIGYLKYKEMFRTHSINGRKLLTVDACFLAKMGITNFADILDLTPRLEQLTNQRLHTCCYPCAMTQLPRLYACNTSGPVNRLDINVPPPRTDALLRAAVAYPWDYYTYS